MRVSKFVESVMPRGTRGTKEWKLHPVWPPDVFAVAAMLVDRTSIYTALLRPNSAAAALRKRDMQENLAEIARLWASGRGFESKEPATSVIAAVQELWQQIVQCKVNITSLDAGRRVSFPDWQIAALKLVIVADLACKGVGFFPFRRLNSDGRTTDPTWIQMEVLYDHIGSQDVSEKSYSKGNLYTLCKFVSPAAACVLPKTRTPRMGCTLRSLTHNLALLPPEGVVRGSWNISLSDDGAKHSFNLLLIPFPYRITGSAFRGWPQNTRTIPRGEEEQQAFFAIDQNWLEPVRDDLPAFILNLIRTARNEVGHIDGIVLPELALDPKLYEALLTVMKEEQDLHVQFLVAGVMRQDNQSTSATDGQPFPFDNTAVTAVFDSFGRHLSSYNFDRKHHRWKLNRSQITQYSLGDALNPAREWWENARIDSREMNFYVFRGGACFTTLICEDLARADPGAHAIRAVGPNLVIALLMDGPQLPARWPGQYAMGLADDPGSSVLTLTSLGLVLRSNQHYGTNSRAVALWRDSATGVTRQLELPQGAHGLVLSLTGQSAEEFTLDGRSDHGNAYEWSLSGCMPVTCMDCPAGLSY